MTVEELIKILNELPLEAEIMILQNDNDVNNSDKLTTVIYQSEYDKYDKENKKQNDIFNHQRVALIAD